MATFTSEAEILRMVGDDGYEALLEDLDDNDKDSFLNDIIDYATAEITTRTQERYLDDSVANDKLVRMNATIIACHFMSERRGNGALWESKIERIYEWLDKIRTGELHLPNQEVLAPDIPIVRNHVINFNSRHRVLVDKEISTGSHSNEHTMPDDLIFPYN